MPHRAAGPFPPRFAFQRPQSRLSRATAGGVGQAETGAGRHEVRALLEEALACLPAELRLVFLLREAEGLPVLAIARDLRLNPITVRTRLYRARRDLRATLETRLRGGSTRCSPATAPAAPAWPAAWSRRSGGASGGEMRPSGQGRRRDAAPGVGAWNEAVRMGGRASSGGADDCEPCVRRCSRACRTCRDAVELHGRKRLFHL
ncbi:sigma factor-like helix-turn-helix DNA-binding protein [Paracoccus sp. (in: a-proteobacteria)]